MGDAKQRLSLSEIYKKLTPTQCRVLDKLMKSSGKTNRQLASELFIEETTLEKHITEIGKVIGKRGRGKVKAWARSKYRKKIE